MASSYDTDFESISRDEQIAVREDDPGSVTSRHLIEELDAYLNQLYPAESNHLVPVESLRMPGVTFLTARFGDRVVGCGAFLDHHGEYAEIKRMFVLPGFRGRGIGRLILHELEGRARSYGLRQARIETGVSQPEALGLYERCGYERRGPFGSYFDDPLSVFMEKRLT